jgi:hypothetical protein
VPFKFTGTINKVVVKLSEASLSPEEQKELGGQEGSNELIVTRTAEWRKGASISTKRPMRLSCAVALLQFSALCHLPLSLVLDP